MPTVTGRRLVLHYQTAPGTLTAVQLTQEYPTDMYVVTSDEPASAEAPPRFFALAVCDTTTPGELANRLIAEVAKLEGADTEPLTLVDPGPAERPLYAAILAALEREASQEAEGRVVGDPNPFLDAVLSLDGASVLSNSTGDVLIDSGLDGLSAIELLSILVNTMILLESPDLISPARVGVELGVDVLTSPLAPVTAVHNTAVGLMYALLARSDTSRSAVAAHYEEASRSLRSRIPLIEHAGKAVVEAVAGITQDMVLDPVAHLSLLYPGYRFVVGGGETVWAYQPGTGGGERTVILVGALDNGTSMGPVLDVLAAEALKGPASTQVAYSYEALPQAFRGQALKFPLLYLTLPVDAAVVRATEVLVANLSPVHLPTAATVTTALGAIEAPLRTVSGVHTLARSGQLPFLSQSAPLQHLKTAVRQFRERVNGHRD